MTKLTDVVNVIRSQRSGLYTHGIDVIFKDFESYKKVKDLGLFTREMIADLYQIPLNQVRVVEYVDQGKAIKISIFRPHAIPMGDQDDADLLGVSQYIPLERVEF